MGEPTIAGSPRLASTARAVDAHYGMQVVTRQECGRADWNQVVHSSPDGWVWATWEWQELIGRVPRWQLEDLSFGVRTGGRLAGVVPLHWIAAACRLSGSGWGLTAPTLANGLADGERDRLWTFIFSEVRALAQKLDARRVEFALSPVSRTALESQRGVNPFVTFGFGDESGHSRILDLRPGADAIFKNFSRDARQQVRKARAAGYTARTVDWQDRVDDYYQLHCQTYARTGVPPHPREYFAGIAEFLAPLGQSVLTAAFSPDGRAVAFHNTARLGASAMYHTGCSADEALQCGANYLAFWEALRSAATSGCEWYELGEIFPGHTTGKTFGLSVFKSKFGGEIHRSFRAGLTFAESAGVTEEPALAETARTAEESARTATANAADAQIRDAYAHGSLYPPSRICLRVGTAGDDYVDRLLTDKLGLIAEHYRGGRIVDLCCGTGAHLLDVADGADAAIGIDFSERYIETANREAREKRLATVSFVLGDARRIPLAANSVDFLYSFSSLYAIPRAGEVVAEVGRVLAPGGQAVLDLGNRRSINAYCTRHYTEWPPIHPMTIREMRMHLAAAGLEPVRHRRFQILPLWAGRPAWLAPLLHPRWKGLLKRRIAGVMLDEWLCRMPVLRGFAFRHVIVCRKRSQE
jgi:SAM-dependent methyltransferase